MIIDLGISLKTGIRVSSFVQMRGSVPTRWSQDVSKVVAKPAIIFDVSDPFHEIAGKSESFDYFSSRRIYNFNLFPYA